MKKEKGLSFKELLSGIDFEFTEGYDGTEIKDLKAKVKAFFDTNQPEAVEEAFKHYFTEINLSVSDSVEEILNLEEVYGFTITKVSKGAIKKLIRAELKGIDGSDDEEIEEFINDCFNREL